MEQKDAASQLNIDGHAG